MVIKIEGILDEAHQTEYIFDQEITKDVWSDKYRAPGEQHPWESHERVVHGVFEGDDSEVMAELALLYMKAGLWMPGGRIHAGAGTDKAVTWMNCYVSQNIPDSMDGIMDALKEAALTMQLGGGIGMNFSTLRPSGAHLQRTGSIASGPMPFMDMWDAMCETIMSAGSRRGAMMGVMADWHPDLPLFIEAKHKAGRLSNFNVSVLISDAFLSAIEDDAEWYLGFEVPPIDREPIAVLDELPDGSPGEWYVYSVWKARELWDLIIRSTYDYAEPGVIFIDRINHWNNLSYRELLECTNPCGEQPLPPYGVCNLGAINLARLVRHPFTSDASIDFVMMNRVVEVGVRFLDNVIDRTPYPLEQQKIEELKTRRIGLGISGLANMFMQLRTPYGSPESLNAAHRVMRAIASSAYRSSSQLALERGSFPDYNAKEYLSRPFLKQLDPSLQDYIGENGIRNGVLLTIAPTGTTSIYYGNISSGLEPAFALEYERKVLQPDDTYKQYSVKDYGYSLYQRISGHKEGDKLPDYMVTAMDLSVKAHVKMQATIQGHVDASVSKTINCPKDISFEDFKEVYSLAHKLGCKGCTTYRPSDVRGSVLTTESDVRKIARRPDTLKGTTYKVPWPHSPSALYVTINDLDDKPYEIFISSRSAAHVEWTTALTLMISAIMKSEEDISFIPEELKLIASPKESAWVDGKHYNSLVARIGEVIETHIRSKQIETEPSMKSIEELHHKMLTHDLGEICPQCNNPTLMSSEGCKTCTQCGFSNCG